MIGLALDTEEQMKRMATGPMGNPNQMLQAAPIQQGMGEQMGDMMKKKLMSDAVETGAGALTTGLTSAGTSALGGSAMAGIGTAVPYVGAGLLAGKALGLFNQGGQVGPLSAQYAYDGDKAKSSLQYQMKMGRQNKKDNEDLVDMIRKNYEFSTDTALRNARAVGAGDPIAERKYGAGMYGTYYDQGGQVGMTEADAMALMNNQPEPIQTMPATKTIPMVGPIMKPNPDELYNEIMAESMTEAAQEAMPMMRPPLMRVDPYGADKTFSPYDMLRPDNAPST